MKQFLVLYKCAENSVAHENWKKLDAEKKEERLKTGERLLNLWNEKYKKQILNNGSALHERTSTVDPSGINENPSEIGSYLIIEATSLREASEIFIDHPHFNVFPGDSIQIIECTKNSRKSSNE